MLKKETFVKVIGLIQEQEEQHSKIDDALSLVMDGNSIFTGSELYYEALMEVLKESMNDSEDYIGWWLYGFSDSADRKVWVDGKDVLLDTPEKLYDFMATLGDDTLAPADTIQSEKPVKNAVVCINETLKHKIIIKSKDGLTPLEAEQCALDLSKSSNFEFIEPDFSELSYEFVREATKSDLKNLRSFDEKTAYI